jgi:hypothetical protein
MNVATPHNIGKDSSLTREEQTRARLGKGMYQSDKYVAANYLYSAEFHTYTTQKSGFTERLIDSLAMLRRADVDGEERESVCGQCR